MPRVARMLYGMLAVLVVLACAVPAFGPAPTSVPVPAFDPNAINTVIALTANSAATQTAQMLPPTWTPTFTPSPTATVTDTPSPTFIFLLATPTVPSNTPVVQRSDLDYDCRVDSQTPADNSVFARGADFETRWTVKNIGQKAWSSESADYRYVNGDKLHKTAVYDLDHSIPPDGGTEIVVAMRAPSEPGTYKTTWKIKTGKTEFCTMRLTILVN